MVITLDSYKFTITDVNEPEGSVDYKGKMEVSYDGNFLGVDVWECPANEEFTPDTPGQCLTLPGANQANLLIGAILALMEAYGEPSFYHDENIQEEYKQMAEETKNEYAKKTTEES